MILKEVGTEVQQKAKYGGSYVVVGHIKCPRNSCNNILELREQQEPSKQHIKVGYYWSEWTMCPKASKGGCGLYNGENKIWL